MIKGKCLNEKLFFLLPSFSVFSQSHNSSTGLTVNEYFHLSSSLELQRRDGSRALNNDENMRNVEKKNLCGLTVCIKLIGFRKGKVKPNIQITQKQLLSLKPKLKRLCDLL